MSERLDSNHRPPEPQSGSLEGEFIGKHVPFTSCGFLRFCNSTRKRPFFKVFSAQLCPRRDRLSRWANRPASSTWCPQTCARTPPLGYAGRCVRSRLAEVRLVQKCGGPTRANGHHLRTHVDG